MFGLVQNHLFELARREPRKKPLWNKNARRKESDHTRAVKIAGGANLNSSRIGSCGQRFTNPRVEPRVDLDPNPAPNLDRSRSLPQSPQPDRMKCEFACAVYRGCKPHGRKVECP